MVDLPMTQTNSVGRMHEFLTPMDKYTKELPFYIENLYSDEDIKALREVWNRGMQLKPIAYGPNEAHDPEEPNAMTRFRPKHIKNMSRLLLEFEMPKSIEEKLDKIAKPLYDGDIALCHYNYIEYNLKYGDGNDPILPPHLDGDENLVTLNTNISSNIDWDIFIDGVRYKLKPGQTVVFAAINQVHWRPKRKFKEGEYLEILSVDYCPTDNYRFTGQINPLDPFRFPEKRKAHTEEVQRHPRSMAAWKQYNEDQSSI
jgi:hypothetical protein